MKHLFILIVLLILSCKSEIQNDYTVDESLFLSHIIDLKESEIKFYLKDKLNKNYSNFKNIKQAIDSTSKKLMFATNGGMFNKEFQPQGLYIENGEIIKNLDTIQPGYGNFYLQPNGVFYITKNNLPKIVSTKNFKYNATINYATQSGPMLIINNKIHEAFNKGSKNLNIRNGVGILPNGKLLFVMSKTKVNFYDFATFFKQNNCANALYLDGFVSKTYLPEKGYNALDGNFGVIIIEKK